jgi:hypothetical protein
VAGGGGGGGRPPPRDEVAEWGCVCCGWPDPPLESRKEPGSKQICIKPFSASKRGLEPHTG